jgi:serine/threonine-protein phosphatase PGAM5
MSQRHIYVVRHGQRLPGSGNDRLGLGITDTGKIQAEFTGERISLIPVNTIYYSTLRRAAETAKIIAKYIPNTRAQGSQLLWECIPYLPGDFITWYKVNRSRITEDRVTTPLQMAPWLNLWSPDTPWDLIEKGFAQAEQAWTHFFRSSRDERHEVLVCHGNILRYFMVRALQAPLETWINSEINNCGISEFTVNPGGEVTLVSHNDTGHLPVPIRTVI